MPEPRRTATGVITESPLVLIDITTADGITGHGIVFTYTAAALRPVADFIQNIAHFVRDEHLESVRLSDQLSARFRLLGTQGVVGMALAGIDMALWDVQARTQGLSQTRLPGGSARPLQA